MPAPTSPPLLGGMPQANPIFTGIATGLLRFTTNFYIGQAATIAGNINIQLQRRVPVPKPGGGSDFTIVGVPMQTFRLTNQTIQNGINYSPNDDGMARKDLYILIGQWDADIQINDWWDDPSGQWKVDGLLPNNGFETRAVVTAFTTDPQYGS